MQSTMTAARRLGALLIVLSGSTAFLAASSGPQDDAGFLWIAESDGLLNVATDVGEIRFEKPHTLGYTAVGVNDVNGDVWAFRFPDLVSHNRFGAQLTSTSIPLGAHVLPPADLIVDGLAGNVWLAIGDSLQRFDQAGVHRQTLSLPGPIVGITLDRANSMLWAALRTAP